MGDIFPACLAEMFATLVPKFIPIYISVFVLKSIKDTFGHFALLNC